MNLTQYLAELNAADPQWGIWVNPENPEEEYRVGQVFENGGVLDDYVFIGSLDDLSFGFQSVDEILNFIFREEGFKNLNERKGNVSLDGIKEAYSEGRLDPEFQSDLEDKIESIWNVWSQEEASYFVDQKIPEIIEACKAQLLYA